VWSPGAFLYLDELSPPLRVCPDGLCLISMDLLDTLIRKYGAREGRKRYNQWHLSSGNQALTGWAFTGTNPGGITSGLPVTPQRLEAIAKLRSMSPQ
jgi:hypothetical protein